MNAAAPLATATAIATREPIAPPEIVAKYLPTSMLERALWGVEAWQWVGLAIIVVAAVVVSTLVERVALAVGVRMARLTRVTWDDKVVGASQHAVRYVVFASLFAAGTRWLSMPPRAQIAFDVLSTWLVIFGVARFLIRLFRIIGDSVLGAASAEPDADAGHLRGLDTQISVLRRVAEIATVVVAVALALMQFEVVRSVGLSLLASAGIAGLVFGLAAQKPLSNLLAGIQLSITQPVRIGDAVVIEGEMGWVEEITLTYVVVRIWDLRRLVLPITQLLDKPFQNWTRRSTEMLGTVEVRADYSVNVDALRAELTRILKDEGAALFNGKAQGVQVTDATERTVTLRALVSAADSGKLFDLRCLVREKLIAFLNAHPDWLPRNRNETHVSQDGKAA